MLGGLLPLLGAAAPQREFDISQMILHHLADAREWESPFGVVRLPQLHIGSFDVSITKHVLFMMIAAVLVAIVLITAARDARREHAAGAQRGPRGAANVVEAVILFLRDEVALKNIGHGGER